MAFLARLTVLLSVLIGASHPAWAASIEGRWYGEDYEQLPGIRTQWLNHRAPDGSFDVEFRRYRHCQLEMQQFESGRWFVDGTTYTTVTEWVDFARLLPGDPHYVERYELKSVDARTMAYLHERTGILFRARRVGPDFDFPACEPMS